MACHLRRNAFESIKTRYVPNYIREQTAPTDVLKNLSGLSLCFLRIKYCLSVGAFFEHLRANTVRPYRVLDNFSAKFARPRAIRPNKEGMSLWHPFFICSECPERLGSAREAQRAQVRIRASRVSGVMRRSSAILNQ